MSVKFAVLPLREASEGYISLAVKSAVAETGEGLKRDLSGRVRIRPIRGADVERLAAAAWDETTPEQIVNRWREQEQGLREMLVAQVDGELVGTVSINPVGDPPRALHLFALDVATGWRDLGVGTDIIRHVVAEAERRRLPRVYLEVRVDNPARRLYHRLGFRRVGGAFVNAWWRFGADGYRERVEETSYRMFKRVPLAMTRALRAGKGYPAP